VNYITILAPSYEEAVKKARDQYGERLRIHSRKDVVSRGFLGLKKNKHCELTCFLAEETSKEDFEITSSKDGSSRTKQDTLKQSVSKNDDIEESDIKRFEQEAKTPDPVSGKYRETDTDKALQEEVLEPTPNYSANIASTDVVSTDVASAEISSNGKAELDELLSYAMKLLYKNDFSTDYIDWILEDLKNQLEPALPAIPSKDEFELLVVDRIVSSVEIDHNSQLHPPRIFVLLGPTGVGKTTTIAKIAAVYGTLPPEEMRKKVSIITMDSFRVGAYEQMENFGKALGIPVLRADDEASFYEALEDTQDSELVLIDTIGRSPKDNELNVKMRTMLNVPDRKNLKYYLTISASMKKVDLDNVFEQFGPFGLNSVIVTKTDETQTIGNILSICRSKHLPLLFITDGQMVPRDIHKASSAFILSLLKGFSMDFNSLWNTQIGSDE